MQDIELAYTPHPDAKRRASPVGAVAAAHTASHAAAPGGLALMAAASLSILSTVALLGPGGVGANLAATTEAIGTPPEPGKVRAFAARETAAEAKAAPAAPVLLAGEPIALETRAASPLPVAGGVLGPVPEPAPATPMPARQQHVLTSFDGTRTMSDGPTIHAAAPAPQQEYASIRPQHSNFPPAPAVWNNPIQWIKVHKEDL